MFLGHNVTGLRSEFGTNLAAPGAVCEGLSRPGCFLNRRNVLPGLVVTRMHRIENAQSSPSRSGQQLKHMRDAIIRLCNAFDAIPYFAALRYEIVIGIDDRKCCDPFVKLQFAMFFPPSAYLN